MSASNLDLEVGLLSASEQMELMESGQLSAAELLEVNLARSETLASSLNALVTIDAESARSAAAECDRERASGSVRGPLHGLSMSVKDGLATAGMLTTGGAVELRDHIPQHDAEVVARARAAGAIVFAKSNVPRWSGELQAFNEIFGTTCNPWDIDRSPGGSSGGSSAAIAAGLTSLEIGTDLGGSIRLPAHFAGVCGHKPSFGVVPQLGYVDRVNYGLNDSDINVVGPLARSVADLALMMNVLTGPRSDHVSSWSLKLNGPSRSPNAFRVAAWLDDSACTVSKEVSDILEAAVRAIVDSGVPVDTEARPGHSFDDVWEVGLPLVSAATLPCRTDEEFALLQSLAASDEPAKAQRAHGSTMTHREWLQLSQRRDHNRLSWSRFFENFDILLAPVAIVPAIPHIQKGSVFSRKLTVDGVERNYSDLLVWNIQFGYVYLPSTVLPVGWTPEGLPVGIQIIGPHLGDNSTLAFAGHIESILGGYRVPPIARL